MCLLFKRDNLTRDGVYDCGANDMGYPGDEGKLNFLPFNFFTRVLCKKIYFKIGFTILFCCAIILYDQWV